MAATKNLDFIKTKAGERDSSELRERERERERSDCFEANPAAPDSRNARSSSPA